MTISTVEPMAMSSQQSSFISVTTWASMEALLSLLLNIYHLHILESFEMNRQHMNKSMTRKPATLCMGLKFILHLPHTSKYFR